MTAVHSVQVVVTVNKNPCHISSLHISDNDQQLKKVLLVRKALIFQTAQNITATIYHFYILNNNVCKGWTASVV
jgi:hypothetical protein